MVGMDVGIDDEVDAHVGILSRAQIWLDLADRVDTAPAALPPQPKR
jgi:hypothetical protein